MRKTKRVGLAGGLCFVIGLSLLAISVPAIALAGGAAVVTDLSRAKHERPEEISFTIRAKVDGVGPEQLARCIARSDRRLRRNADPERTFARVRWTSGEYEALRTCNDNGCKFEFSKSAQRQLARAGSDISQRKSVYYRLVHEATVRAKKKQKDHRIKAHEVKRSFDGRCVRHGAFNWLLDGPLKSHDKLVWRKINASSRMRPTMTTMQQYSWNAGPSVCVGKSLLFADHYYDDHLELFELRPAKDGQLELAYHVRSRFDFFNSWWARRFKGTIASKLTKVSKRQFVRLVDRCAKRTMMAASR